MTDVQYDFSKLTKKQLEVLGQISINNDGGHHPKTLAALERRGLIECFSHWDGPWEIFHWRMPLPVHMAWCAWCAEQDLSEELE